MDPEALLARAAEAMERAYAPYSGFRVGAAVLAEDGSVFAGCNVENASYGLTVCAERAAVAAAVAQGHRRFTAVALRTTGKHPVAPCGACRQVLAEFGDDMVVVSAAGDEVTRWTLSELLPAPFQGLDVLPRNDG